MMRARPATGFDLSAAEMTRVVLILYEGAQELFPANWESACAEWGVRAPRVRIADGEIFLALYYFFRPVIERQAMAGARFHLN